MAGNGPPGRATSGVQVADHVSRGDIAGPGFQLLRCDFRILRILRYPLGLRVNSRNVRPVKLRRIAWIDNRHLAVTERTVDGFDYNPSNCRVRKNNNPVLRWNRNFVLATFDAPGHAMNGERSAIPYQFWFAPAACQQCWHHSPPRLSSETSTPGIERETLEAKTLGAGERPIEFSGDRPKTIAMESVGRRRRKRMAHSAKGTLSQFSGPTLYCYLAVFCLIGAKRCLSRFLIHRLGVCCRGLKTTSRLRNTSSTVSGSPSTDVSH